jgi:hypothetical protein
MDLVTQHETAGPPGGPSCEHTSGELGDIRRLAIPSVLDTSFVRTGLVCQLKSGGPPASLAAAQDGTIRLFMEQETMGETFEKLPLFATRLDVPLPALERMFVDAWLPYIRVVALSGGFRELDRRAAAVRDRDADDYPAAALAALLSPCILLTHNHRDFGPLGTREWSQGVRAVGATIDLKASENRQQGAVLLPAAPVVAVGAGAKWVADRIGSAAWVILGLLVVAGIVAFQRQSDDRRDGIKRGETGSREQPALLPVSRWKSTSKQSARWNKRRSSSARTPCQHRPAAHQRRQ